MSYKFDDKWDYMGVTYNDGTYKDVDVRDIRKQVDPDDTMSISKLKKAIIKVLSNI